MGRPPDRPRRARRGDLAQAVVASGAHEAPQSTLGVRRVLVVDADPALAGLLEAWLAPQGCSVVTEGGCDLAPGQRFDLVIVDIPFPRQGGVATLQRLAQAYPGAPILALSSAFFASVDARGAVARTLGVASVLPKPVTREALVTAVCRVLQ